MKTYLKITTMIFAAILMVGCEEEITVLQPLEGGHVQLQTSSGVSVSEGSTTGASFKVQLGAMVNTDGYTATFTVESDDNARFTTSPSNGELYFAPNTYESSITIIPIDNVINDGNLKITLSLSGSNTGVYGNDELRSVVLTISDDDCPTEISTTYVGNVSAFGGYAAPEFEVELVKVEDNVYYAETLWGPNFVAWGAGSAAYNGLYVYPGVITINDDFTVTVEGGTEPFAGAYPGGSGTYSACDDEFVISLPDGVFNGGGAGATVTLTGKDD